MCGFIVVIVVFAAIVEIGLKCSRFPPKKILFSMYIYDTSKLAFASLESLGQDKTFKSLESLVRLFQKVLKLIIL